MLLMNLSLMFACQEKEPLTCEYDGQTYEVGEGFDASDGCNSCSCDAYEGETMVACTEMDCGPPSCGDLTADECSTYENCVTITASLTVVNPEEECLDWANSVENVGCMDADMACGDAITYAASADDPTQCYGFTSTCVPQGWSDCNLDGYPECN